MTTGKEKFEAMGTSTVGHMVQRGEVDELEVKKGAEAHGAFVVERTRVVVKGRVVVIQAGILSVSQVKTTANEIVEAFSLCFEWL